MNEQSLVDPFGVFNFQVEFREMPLGSKAGDALLLCRGAFAECSGLEATMEPKSIPEGGRNFGAVQRAGPVTFATVILKRGVTRSQHLRQWFELVNRRSAYAHRLKVTIKLWDARQNTLMAWTLLNALPVKFKAPDLRASAAEVGIEELHLVHEGLEWEGAPKP